MTNKTGPIRQLAETYLTNTTYKTYRSHRTYLTFLVLFFAFVIFQLAPQTASASILSKAPNNLGLVGYWPLNEGSGTVATDHSGNGNIGTLSGTTIPNWTTGKRGGALNFDGLSGYVNIPSIPASSFTNKSFSWSAWVKGVENGSPINMPVIGYGSGSWFRLGFRQISGVWGFDSYYDGVTNARVICGPAVSSTQWVHLVVVAQYGGNISCYQNGVLAGSPLAYVNNVTDASGFGIGTGVGSYSPWGDYFSGSIDDVRIYNRLLSQSDVTALYQSGSVKVQLGDKNGLVGYWPLNDGNGTQAGDFSGNGRTGTITGATWTSGKRGGALSFDGVNNTVSLSGSLPLNPSGFTFSHWIKTTSSAGQMYTIGNAGGGDGYRFGLSNGNISFLIGDTPHSYTETTCGTAKANDGKWHLITGTFQSSGNFSCYLDGVFLASVAVGNFSSMQTGAPGLGKPPCCVAFAGSMDDIRIYNRILSAAEISNLYNSKETAVNHSQNSKVANGLGAFWSFNGPDVSGTNATDLSGNSNTLSFIGPQLVPGKVGQGLSFNGTSASASSSASLNITDNLSISLWFYPRAEFVGYAVHPITKWTGTTDANYVLYYFGTTSGLDNVLALYANAGGTWQSISTFYTVVPGNWYHYVFTYNSVSGGKTYINGSLFGTTGGAGVLATNATNLSLGDSGNMILDEVRVYNRVLSAAEAFQLYKLGQ